MSNSSLNPRKSPPAVYPLFGILAFAVGGLSFFLWNRVTRPDIHWTKSNSEPWQNVKQDETYKLYDPNGYFKGYWSRFFGKKE